MGYKRNELFRQEVFHAQGRSIFGGVLIPASRYINVLVMATIAIILSVVLFITFGQFTRKAQLTGVVMPSSGLIKVAPKFPGYVTELLVKEGDNVKAGAPLYRISGEYYDHQGGGFLAALRLNLQTQYLMLTSQEQQEQQEISLQLSTTKQRIAELELQIKSALQRLRLSEYQVNLSAEILLKYRKLITGNYVSDMELRQKEVDYSSLQIDLENNRQSLLQYQTAQASATNDLERIKLQGERRATEVNRQLHTIRQQQLEVSGQEKFTLTSPVDGIVATILVREGQIVRPQEPALMVVPDNSHLIIELYAISKNAGFIRLGQKAGIRFASFPHQKFGVQYGTVREVSRTAVMPSELTSVSPVVWKENEGHYRVIVEPDHQYIIAYGKKEFLRPGMLVEGDVRLDTRYLWEWLTEPLWSLRGKI